MQTITTSQIRDAFVQSILNITPTYEPLRDSMWSYVPSARQGGRALLQGKGLRSFDLIFGAGTPSYLWYGTGEAYRGIVRVATSYSDIDPELLEHMVTADAIDLRRAFAQLRDPGLPGFVDAIAAGVQNELVDDEANVYVEHVFEIHWHQSTDEFDP